MDIVGDLPGLPDSSLLALWIAVSDDSNRYNSFKLTNNNETGQKQEVDAEDLQKIATRPQSALYEVLQSQALAIFALILSQLRLYDNYLINIDTPISNCDGLLRVS